jgi:alkylated DNA repair dioxygenase AlkB
MSQAIKESDRSPFTRDLFEDLPLPDVLWQLEWLTPFAADALQRSLVAQVKWKQDHMHVGGGREVALPRLTAWQGDDGAEYVYSGIRNRPDTWSTVVFDIKERLERELKVPFNSVLLNRYRSGTDSIGWHADDEPELGPTPVIASLFLGSTRTFELRRNPTVDEIPVKHSFPLTAGSLLVMRGHTQRDWKHQVPKEPQVQGERLNLTFRFVVPPEPHYDE